MPHNVKSERTKEWLLLAKNDLASGQYQLQSAEQFTRQVSFQAQQCAEKAIKAMLVWHQVRFAKQHDLRYLGDLLLDKEPTLQLVIDQATNLNPYAVMIRYPGFAEVPTLNEAVEALKVAEKLYNEILGKLPKETHP